uniref:Uncharacterized protein n=1 Tax=Zea mays TaxID=4577 RepID=B4FI62_MAIZE|nr:unknown [Zea mays]
MEFARRGHGDEDIDDMHRFIDLPPPHVDPLLVIREALLSQLQKDRLRQEIIQGAVHATLAMVSQSRMLCRCG